LSDDEMIDLLKKAKDPKELAYLNMDMSKQSLPSDGSECNWNAYMLIDEFLLILHNFPLFRLDSLFRIAFWSRLSVSLLFFVDAMRKR